MQALVHQYLMPCTFVLMAVCMHCGHALHDVHTHALTHTHTHAHARTHVHTHTPTQAAGGHARTRMLLRGQVVVTPQTRAAFEDARTHGRSTWRVSSTLFVHLASDAILEPLGHFAHAQPEALSRYPPRPAGVQVCMFGYVGAVLGHRRFWLGWAVVANLGGGCACSTVQSRSLDCGCAVRLPSGHKRLRPLECVALLQDSPQATYIQG